MVDAYTYSDGGFRLERLANGWQVGRFAALEAIGMTHLVTTRRGPDVQQVRRDPVTAGREITRVLDLQEAAFLEQVHGGAVVEAAAGGCAGFADGLVTTAKDLALVGKSGDCPIILIADRGGRAVGFAHASWRATVAGITSAVVRRMAERGCDPSDLVACVCPSAGPCCYEVGADVRAAALRDIGPHAASFFRLAESARPRPRAVALVEQAVGAPGSHGRAAGAAAAHAGPLHFDLWRANACALARAGLAAGSIHVAGLCTICYNDLVRGGRRRTLCRGDRSGDRWLRVLGARETLVAPCVPVCRGGFCAFLVCSCEHTTNQGFRASAVCPCKTESRARTRPGGGCMTVLARLRGNGSSVPAR